MKHTQVKYIVGYVTLHIKGEYPELFFQHCADQGISLWDVEKKTNDICQGTTFLENLSMVRSLVDESHYDIIQVHAPKGIMPAMSRLWKRKDVLFTALLCMMLLFVLSNIAWNIEFSNVTEDTERKIKETLEKEGLYEGAWTFNLNDINNIQQNVLHELPDLMYIGISKNGTTYHIDAIEKRQEKRAEKLPQRDLVASKDGEIKRIFVKKGMSKVAVHDIVKKGDLLISGLIEDEEKTDEDKKKDNTQKVAAEGDIYANTWYEMDVTASLKQTSSSLTGEKHKKVNIALPNFSFPVWGFNQPFEDYIKEEKNYTFQLFKHKFPLSIMTETFYKADKEYVTENNKETKQRIIKHIENSLQRNTGKEAEILYYKVLHERTESGKVKINLYVSVLENIAEERVSH